MSCLGLDMAKFFHLWCFIVTVECNSAYFGASGAEESIPHLLYDHASGCVLYSFGETPIELEIVFQNGSSTWITSQYEAVDGCCAASARVVTPGGSVLQVADTFANATKAGFRLDRSIQVVSASPDEAGFSSRVSIIRSSEQICPDAPAATDAEFFMPGVWYRRNEGAVPPGSLAGDSQAATILVREDRLALPLVSVRDPASGSVLELVHANPDGGSFAGETRASRVTDARLQFGSLGVVRSRYGASDLSVVFQFPGSEGDRTYLPGSDDGWANRSHPMQTGFAQHRYSLRVSLEPEWGGRGASFGGAVLATWSRAFCEASPRPPRANRTLVYRASVDLLAQYTRNYSGVPLVPFRANLPDGVVDDTSSLFGFVGKAPSAAALLLRDAVDTGNAARRDAAERVLDFWASRAATDSGVPRAWFNVAGPDSITWRQDSVYMGHVRILSEGSRGALRAWSVEPERGTAWFDLARGLGDFLLSVQSPDGSILGSWGWNGSALANFTDATAHPVPFLVDLHNATGELKYLDAAVRAGEFAAQQVGLSFRYIGGTCDHNNVLDKEAGVLAMQAFLALWRATGNRSWIEPAVQAATFAATWTYAWDVPAVPDDPDVVYPRKRTALGASTIATGHSGVDNFMASAVRDYESLAQASGEPFFAKFASFLADATMQVVDWDGALGYAFPGLMNEAVTFAPPRGHGVRKWLPWLTVAVLDPMVKF